MTTFETFPGVIGRNAADSTPHWPEPPQHAGAVNVVYVVLDDVGFADLGCYGSEIATPNLDRLADEGVRYTDFHVNPMCSPTRCSDRSASRRLGRRGGDGRGGDADPTASVAGH